MPNSPTPDEITRAPSPPPLRVLHLEDNLNDASLIAWTLRMAGIQCRVTRVEDEQTYLAAIRQGDLDLILSDCNVGGFSGLAALSLALTEKVRAPFVFVSGTTTPEMRRSFIEQGATDCLSKDHRIQLVFLAQRIWMNQHGAH